MSLGHGNVPTQIERFPEEQRRCRDGAVSPNSTHPTCWQYNSRRWRVLLLVLPAGRGQCPDGRAISAKQSSFISRSSILVPILVEEFTCCVCPLEVNVCSGSNELVPLLGAEGTPLESLGIHLLKEVGCNVSRHEVRLGQGS